MNKTKATDKKNCYHHGNLRDALIIAAAELIEENGSLDFAMIDAARRAGVSSAAPYRHFKDRDELLQAVSQVAFIALSEAARLTVQEHPRGSAERIIALGRGYICFMTEHPEFYDLMWGKTGVPMADSEDDELQTSGFYQLSDAVSAWCQETGVECKDPIDLATKLWAIAHGVGGLAMNGHLEKFIPAADVDLLIESSTHTFLGGLQRKN
ncbi:MAG: TetR/AcrR family transcriptional regulator [Halioglobus sp.]